jgi:hypothetical protein
MYYDDRTVFPLGKRAAADYGFEEPWFEGGDHSEGSGAAYEDLELKITPGSMERPDTLQRSARQVEGMRISIEMSVAVAAAPHLPWRQYFERLSRAYNLPELRYANVEAMVRAGGIAAQYLGPARFGRDVGQAGSPQGNTGQPSITIGQGGFGQPARPGAGAPQGQGLSNVGGQGQAGAA